MRPTRRSGSRWARAGHPRRRAPSVARFYDRGMVSDTPGGRRVKVTAELIVDITDAAAVRSAALAAIDQAQFSPDPDSTEDDARAAERERVTEDPAFAVDWLVDT